MEQGKCNYASILNRKVLFLILVSFIIAKILQTKRSAKNYPVSASLNF